MMKLSFILSILAIMQVSAASYAQRVSLHVKSASIDEVFYKLTQQTGHTFTADAELVKKLQPIDLNMRNVTLKEVLNSCFEGQHVNIFYNDEDKIVVIRKSHEEKAVVQSSITVRGKVTDEEGQPLIGATVRIKNQTIETVSNTNGEYSIKVPDGNVVLVFSSVGFASQEINLNRRETVNMVLKRAHVDIEETVVVAYGTVSKKDLTGSVGTVNIEELSKAPVTTFTQALAGRVAGLQVSSSEGQPGMMQDIVIRGPGSLTQDPSPLYVVDGFPMDNFDVSTLNTNDIESISVLKDASATALYGSRAANGIIVIETKKGKSGKPQITLNSSFGLQQIRKKIDVMNAYEFVKYQEELFPDVAARRYYQNGKTLADYEGAESVNWQDKLFRTSPLQMYDFAIRGGNLYTQYALSGSLFDNEGIILNTGATRQQGRVALDHTLSGKLRTGVTANYTNHRTYGAQASQQAAGASTNSNSIFYPAFGYRPVSGRDDIDLSDDNVDDLMDPAFPNERRVNPVRQATNTHEVHQTKSLYVNAFLSYKINNDLTFKTTGNFRDIVRKSEYFYNSNTPRGLDIPLNDRGVQGNLRSLVSGGWLNENTLTYDKRYGRLHRLNALLGFSAGGGTSKSDGVDVMKIPNEELGVSGMGQGTPFEVYSASSSNTVASFFGRVNYNFKSKYLLTATFRADGSSKFPTENKWGYFPSGAFAWNIDQEEFFKKVTFMSTAKLRTSYGVTGNNRVSDFGYLPNLSFPIANSYSFNNSTPTKGAIPGGLGNDKLKWESTEQVDVGLDLGFFKKRIELTVDLYRRTTDDMLLEADLPFATGYARVYQNIGKLQNDGLEFSLHTQNIVKNNFRWESSFNISFNRNKILALTRDQSEMYRNNLFHFQYTESFNISRLGESAGQFYGYDWIGNYQYADFDETSPGVYQLKDDVADNGSPRGNIRPGDIKYRDVNGDKRITEEDKVIMGRALPKHFGGFNNNFSYKNFDLNIFFQWSYGNHVYNANRLIFEGNSIRVSDLNQYASYADRWSPENQDSKNYRTDGGGPVGFHSSRVLEDGSYLRLKTLALNYNFPVHFAKRLSMSGLSLGVSGQNLWTWTKYTGFDPEVAVRNSVLTPGLDYSAYPQSKTFVASLKASF